MNVFTVILPKMYAAYDRIMSNNSQINYAYDTTNFRTRVKSMLLNLPKMSLMCTPQMLAYMEFVSRQ